MPVVTRSVTESTRRIFYQAGAVFFCRARRDAEDRGHFLGRPSQDDHGGDLVLPWREARRSRGVRDRRTALLGV